MDKTKTTHIAGLTHYIRADGIYVFEFVDNQRETLDAWVQLSRQFDQTAAAEGRHLRTLFSIVALPTPYALLILLREAVLTPKNLRESIAIITPPGTMFSAAQTVLEKMPLRTQQAARLFTSEEEALRWLEERLSLLGE